MHITGDQIHVSVARVPPFTIMVREVGVFYLFTQEYLLQRTSLNAVSFEMFLNYVYDSGSVSLKGLKVSFSVVS